MLPDSKIAEIFFVIDEFFHVFDATGKEADDMTFKPFFSIGARYKRMKETSKGVLSRQLYQYKVGKLPELEHQVEERRITPFYADDFPFLTLFFAVKAAFPSVLHILPILFGFYFSVH